jgi:hypothetical protein
MKTNPMLARLDRKISDVLGQQLELERQLVLLRKLREELAPLVRKRAKGRATAPAPVPVDETSRAPIGEL